MAAWTLREYDRLFRDFPPTSPNSPHGDDLAGIVRDLGRTTGAIVAQWNDARSAVLQSKTEASEQLLVYLERHRWLRRGVKWSEFVLPRRQQELQGGRGSTGLAKAWVAGRPAPFATTGERPWKDAIAAQTPGPSGGSHSGLVLEFSLPPPPSWPAHPDIDNLCEPVFSTVINRLGWFGSSRPNLAWYLASKRPAADPGVMISVVASPAPDRTTVLTRSAFSATWPGPLPRSARDERFVTWARQRGAPLEPGPLAVVLEFGGSRVNIGDVATGPVKCVIDCLQPIFGGPFGNPDDHRVVLLLVAKHVAGVAQGAVRVTIGTLV